MTDELRARAEVGREISALVAVLPTTNLEQVPEQIIKCRDNILSILKREEPEAVAWYCDQPGFREVVLERPKKIAMAVGYRPLYTSPPASRDEMAMEGGKELRPPDDIPDEDYRAALVRAIEENKQVERDHLAMEKLRNLNFVWQLEVDRFEATLTGRAERVHAPKKMDPVDAILAEEGDERE